MNLHQFKIILNFLYVCQSVSWLTFLLKLDKYRDISSFGLFIFLNFFEGIPLMFVHLSQIILNSVCLSVCLLAYFLTEIIQIQQYIQFWMRHLFEIFQRHSCDVGTLAKYNSEYLACLSVRQLTYFFTKNRQIQEYLQFWIRYLSETFWRHFL